MDRATPAAWTQAAIATKSVSLADMKQLGTPGALAVATPAVTTLADTCKTGQQQSYSTAFVQAGHHDAKA